MSDDAGAAAIAKVGFFPFWVGLHTAAVQSQTSMRYKMQNVQPGGLSRNGVILAKTQTFATACTSLGLDTNY